MDPSFVGLPFLEFTLHGIGRRLGKLGAAFIKGSVLGDVAGHGLDDRRLHLVADDSRSGASVDGPPPAFSEFFVGVTRAREGMPPGRVLREDRDHTQGETKVIGCGHVARLVMRGAGPVSKGSPLVLVEPFLGRPGQRRCCARGGHWASALRASASMRARRSAPALLQAASAA
jgi:hypothetical protein